MRTGSVRASMVRASVTCRKSPDGEPAAALCGAALARSGVGLGSVPGCAGQARSAAAAMARSPRAAASRMPPTRVQGARPPFRKKFWAKDTPALAADACRARARAGPPRARHGSARERGL
jgi:hypothetical protein